MYFDCTPTSHGNVIGKGIGSLLKAVECERVDLAFRPLALLVVPEDTRLKKSAK